jgi:hypothetical protein
MQYEDDGQAALAEHVDVIVDHVNGDAFLALFDHGNEGFLDVDDDEGGRGWGVGLLLGVEGNGDKETGRQGEEEKDEKETGRPGDKGKNGMFFHGVKGLVEVKIKNFLVLTDGHRFRVQIKRESGICVIREICESFMLADFADLADCASRNGSFSSGPGVEISDRSWLEVV